MSKYQHITVRAKDLQEGDLVDMKSCPFSKKDMEAEMRYHKVSAVTLGPINAEVDYEDRTIVYLQHTELKVKREIDIDGEFNVVLKLAHQIKKGDKILVNQEISNMLIMQKVTSTEHNATHAVLMATEAHMHILAKNEIVPVLVAVERGSGANL